MKKFFEDSKSVLMSGRVLVLLGVAALAVPVMNPARFSQFTKDWSYVDLLGHSMEVDRMFASAFPGIREFFYYNAVGIFTAYLTGLLMLLGVLGVLLTLGKRSKIKAAGAALMSVCGLLTAILSVVMLFNVSGALNKASSEAYAALDIHYALNPGMFFFLVLGALLFVFGIKARSALKKEQGIYMKMSRAMRRENVKGFMFISPYLIGFSAFIAIPLIFSMFSSFTYYNITAVQKWYGFGNYVDLFTGDQYFWKSLYNTLYYVVFSVPLVLIVSMVFALLLNLRIKGMRIFRTIYYLPSVLSGVAVFLLWQWIFDPNAGLLNQGLALIGISGPAWLYDPMFTKPAMIIMRLWSTGSTVIILLAALQSVPKDLYEAASLDGAMGIKKFFHITLPMISPTLFFVMVTGVSSAFQIFDQAFIMTDGTGGPDKSLLFYNFYLYDTAFEDMLMGKASAMAWILFIIIMFFTLIQTYVSNKWVYYEGGK